MSAAHVHPDGQDTILDRPPLVTIGVPIYNEARFIDQTLRSLRAQDYPNLDIVVSDNASTDETLAICQLHASADQRIRLVRQQSNIGATGNFEHVLDLARGKYFMWAAGHDLWTPGLVHECVALLEANPDAPLAFPCSRWIDAGGHPFPRLTGWTDTRGLPPVARLFTVFWGSMHPLMGVIRTGMLRACRPLPNVVGGDLVLLTMLVLRGDFLHARHSEWARREFRKEQAYKDKIARYASDTTGIARSRVAKVFPLLELPLALMRVVARSNLPMLDKVTALFALLASFPVRYVVGRRHSTG